MSSYTTFQRSFWNDDYILKLNKDQKLVYSYLITNDKTQQCGIYELAVSKACFELGYSPEEFLMHLKKFKDDCKIEYSMETQEVCIINWLKHNTYRNWQSAELVKKQLADVKNPALVLILYDPRKPLYNGNRKVNGEIIPYQIENPWEEVFKDITDEDLRMIRAKYKKNIAISMDDKHLTEVIEKTLIPYGYPIDRGLCITEHKHNINININKNITKTETDDFFSFENTPFQKIIHKSERIQAMIASSKKLKCFPTDNRLIVNIPDFGQIAESLSYYTEEEIKQALQNYEKISNDRETYQITPYKKITNFLINGIQSFVDSANPFELYKKNTFNTDPKITDLQWLEAKEQAGEITEEEKIRLEELRNG